MVEESSRKERMEIAMCGCVYTALNISPFTIYDQPEASEDVKQEDDIWKYGNIGKR